MKENQKLSGVKFTTPTFRLSFPHLWKPHKATPTADPKFSICMLFPKDADRKLMNDALLKAGIECWGPKAKWPKVALPWRDGNEKSDLAGYEGQIYANADTRAESPPGVVNRNREPADQNEVYAGCYARAVVTAKAIPNVGGKNYLKFYLNHVQKVADGEHLDGRDDAATAFADDLPSDGGDDGLGGDIESDDDDDGLGF